MIRTTLLSSAAVLFALTACTDPVDPPPPGVPGVGTQLTIRTLSPEAFSNPTADLCEEFISTTGTVRAISNYAIVVSDNENPAGFSNTDYQQIANEFDGLIYPTSVSYFGTPTDLDDNSGHVILYYTASVNRLTPAGEANSSGYVGGFFFAGDLFSPANDCAASNNGEIFYLLAPDPNAELGNTFGVGEVRQLTRGTVAHEFQHMINSSIRFASGAQFEVRWLDEALAHFAEDAVGRVAAGLTDLEEVNETKLGQMTERNYDAFFSQNLVRGKYYITNPDTTGPIANQEKADNLAARGAQWLFLRYAADWLSNDNPRSLTRRLVAGPETDVTNFVARTGVPLDTSLARWRVTLYTDHISPAIPNLAARYQYRSYDMREVISNTTFSGNQGNGQYLPIDNLGASSLVNVPTTIAATSASYFIINPGTGNRTVTFPSGPAPTSPAADATASNIGTMAIGDVRVLSFGQARNGLTIPSTSSTARYLMIMGTVSGNTDALVQYTVRGQGVAPVSSLHASTTLMMANGDGPRRSMMAPSSDGALQRTIENRIRDYERASLGQGGLSARGSRNIPLRTQTTPPATANDIRIYIVRLS